jgi:hypothetical protein
MIAKMKPGTPRIALVDPKSSAAEKSPITAAIATARYGPKARMSKR